VCLLRYSAQQQYTSAAKQTAAGIFAFTLPFYPPPAGELPAASLGFYSTRRILAPAWASLDSMWS